MAGEPDPLGSLADMPPNSANSSSGFGTGLPVSLRSKQPVSPLAHLHNTAFDIGSPMAAAVQPTAFSTGLPDLADFQSSAAGFGSVSGSLPTAELASISLDETSDPPEPDAAALPPPASAATTAAPAAIAAAARATASPPPAAPAGAPQPQLPAAASKPEAAVINQLSLSPSATMLEELLLPTIPAGAPVKIYIRNPEKVELTTMGMVYSHYYTYLVHTEFAAANTTAHSSSRTPPPVRRTLDASAAPSPAAADSPLSTYSDHTGDGNSSHTPPPAAAGPGAQTVEVRRRFSDFESLYRLLKAAYPGYFVPALPEKAFFDSRFARDNFLKVRQVDLQACVRAIAAHPVLAGSKELQLFLGFAGDLGSCQCWQQLLADSAGTVEALLHRWTAGAAAGGEAAGASGGGGGRSSPGPYSSTPTAAAGQLAAQGGGGEGAKKGGAPALLLRMKHSLMGVAKPKPKHELSGLELELRQAKELLKELQQQLSASCASARSLMQHMEAACEDWGDLARHYGSMARFDEGSAQRLGQYTPSGQNASARAADLQTTAYAELKTHNLWRQFSLRSAASLVYLHDYSVLVPEAIATLEQREAVLAGVHMLADELREKQAAAERMVASGGGVLTAGGGGSAAAAQERKLLQLKAYLVQLQDQLLAGQQHYQQLCERNKAELIRLNLERRKDFHDAMLSFANVQVQLHQAAAEIWATCSEQLQVSPAAAM